MLVASRVRSKRTQPSLAGALVASLGAALPLGIAATAAADPPVDARAAAPPGAGSPEVASAVSALLTWAQATKAHVGVAVVDVETGASLAAVDEHRPMNPA